jgi:dephospho-CoA kinase
MERDKVSQEAILERMQHQWNDEEKSALADFLIVNDGSELVIPQVLSIHRSLLDIGSPGG